MERFAKKTRKVLLRVSLGLVKPRSKIASGNEESEERIDIYASSDMKTVMNLGVENDEFFEMVEKIQAVLGTFASYASSWVVQHVIQNFLKLAKFSPIRGSSCIDLPFRIRESQKLINIKNHDDHICFKFCFTAAYSLKDAIDLLLTDQQKANPAAARTQPDFYTAEKAHTAHGTFDLPMSLASIENFDVRVNVFQYQKGDLFPKYITKQPNNCSYTEIEIFDMGLFLLSEPANFYYAL